MDGLWAFALLFLTAALPVLAAFGWFRARGFSLTPVWFFFSLLAGTLALFVAAVAQYFFPPVPVFPGRSGPGEILWGIFLRIALTEEGGRLVMLILLFRLKRAVSPQDSGGAVLLSPPALSAATGLLTGLGFALVENASYGAADAGITLVRLLTAAPLHGACGARVGLAAASFREAPVRSAFRFFTAVAIHGMYNFMLLNPGVSPVFPVLLALSALAASVQVIHRG
jgi:RsiW-degrading membrane proteinase PrsW (M82 family)